MLCVVQGNPGAAGERGPSGEAGPLVRYMPLCVDTCCRTSKIWHIIESFTKGMFMDDSISCSSSTNIRCFNRTPDCTLALGNQQSLLFECSELCRSMINDCGGY